MKKTDKKTKWKYGLLAIFFIFAMTAPEVYQFINLGINNKQTQPKSWFDPRLSDFFYDDTIDEPSYNFNAYNESYIVCKIQNTAYANFTLDGIIYNVSYGMNYIPIDFGNINQTYTVNFDSDDISADVYDSFTVEPVIIKSGLIEINPDTTSNIVFNASGLISFLITWDCTSFNNFTYDELYVEYDGTVINEVRTDWDHEKEIDPLLISTFRFGGPYIEYSIFTEPGEHTIKLKGNASVDYIIVICDDWDGDEFSNVEEIQKSEVEINSLYDIYKPLIYGTFVMGSGYKVITDYENEIGVYFVSIPEFYNEQYLLGVLLLFGAGYEILYSSRYVGSDPILSSEFETVLGRYLPDKCGCEGCSLWMRLTE